MDIGFSLEEPWVVAAGPGDSKSSLEAAAAIHLWLVILVEEREPGVARSSIFPKTWRSGFYMKSPSLGTGFDGKYCKG